MTRPLCFRDYSMHLFFGHSHLQNTSQFLLQMYFSKCCEKEVYRVILKIQGSSFATRWAGYTRILQTNLHWWIRRSFVFSPQGYMRSEFHFTMCCILCQFLTHCRFVEYFLHLYQSKPFPLDKFLLLPVLCKAVLHHFSRKNLLLSVHGRHTPVTIIWPPEAQF